MAVEQQYGQLTCYQKLKSLISHFDKDTYSLTAPWAYKYFIWVWMQRQFYIQRYNTQHFNTFAEEKLENKIYSSKIKTFQGFCAIFNLFGTLWSFKIFPKQDC